jgi:DNA replication protein DnaC
MNNINMQRTNELALLTAEAAEARKRVAQRIENRNNALHKDEVSDSEYRRRLQISLKRDRVIVEDNKEVRIKASLENWKAKVGPTFAHATTELPLVTDRVARLAEGEGQHKTSICLHGDLGVGKTWTAYSYINLAIASGAVTDGQIVADTETATLGKIAKSGYKAPLLWDELLNPRYKIYFIDDVGQSNFSQEHGRTEVWYELVDHIYNHQLTLILTTNKAFTENSLGAWVGKRAFDRIKTLVGSDGLVEPGRFNRRPAVFEERESQYRKN